jgi:hypothetical protein
MWGFANIAKQAREMIERADRVIGDTGDEQDENEQDDGAVADGDQSADVDGEEEDGDGDGDASLGLNAASAAEAAQLARGFITNLFGERSPGSPGSGGDGNDHAAAVGGKPSVSTAHSGADTGDEVDAANDDDEEEEEGSLVHQATAGLGGMLSLLSRATRSVGGGVATVAFHQCLSPTRCPLLPLTASRAITPPPCCWPGLCRVA